MTTSFNIATSTETPRRRIGPMGTVGRAVLGIVLLAGAVRMGLSWIDLALGLVVANVVVFCVMTARGADAPPMRFTGAGGHLTNLAVGIPFVTFWPEAGLVFYGSALVLAAARGLAACEMLAVWNLVRGRDDRIGCPVFSPIDHLEEQLTGRPRQC